MISLQLKEKTRDFHDRAEATNYSANIMDGSLTQDQYVELLCRNYWLNHKIEQNADSMRATELFPLLNLESRKKSHLALNDLNRLGIKNVSEPDVNFPQLSHSELLGALYVVEGSTLGGQLISKKLESNPNLNDIPKSQFYAGYERDTGKLWKSFLEGLNRYSAESLYSEAEVLSGATKAYQYLIDLSQDNN